MNFSDHNGSKQAYPDKGVGLQGKNDSCEPYASIRVSLQGSNSSDQASPDLVVSF